MKTKFFTHQSKQFTHRQGACAMSMSLFITLLVFCGSIAAFGMTFFAPNTSVVHAAPAPVDSAQQTRFQGPADPVTITLQDSQWDYDLDVYPPIANASGKLEIYDDSGTSVLSPTLTTDASGQVTVDLSTLTSGEYYNFSFTGFNGYADKTFYNEYVDDGTTTMEFTLDQLPSVAGTLHDASSSCYYDEFDNYVCTPIADTTGTITFYDPYDVNIVLAEVEVTTDANGVYNTGPLTVTINTECKIGFSGFEGFADNQYRSWGNTTLDFDEASWEYIYAGENTVDAHLKAAFHISGVLQDPDGNPIANATGDVIFATGSVFDTQTVTTAADGSFTVTSYELAADREYRLYYSGFDDDGANGYPGQYHDGADGAMLDFYDATPVYFAKGENTLDPSTLHPSVLVNGTLRDATTNNPIANTEGTVRLYIDDYNSIDFDITTNASGGYELKVLANTYRVWFAMDGYPGQYYDSAEERVTKWADAEALEWTKDSNTFDAKLQPYATIKGTLLDATTGKPIANASGGVYVWHSRYDDYDYYTLETDAQGAFAITTDDYGDGIMPGTHWLEFRDLDDVGTYGYPDQFYNEAGKLVTSDYYGDVPDDADEVELKPGDNSLSVKLTPYASIKGTLLDASSNELIANASGRLYFNDDYWYHLIETDANGTYQMTKTYKLMPGSYTFWYESFDDEGYPGQYHDKQLDEDDAIEVTLQPGDNAITSHLLRGTCLSGKVTDAQTTKAIKDTWLDINFYDATHGGWLGYLEGYLQDDGSYSLYNLLPAGSHKLEFTTDGYNSRFYDDDDVLKDAQTVTVPDDGGEGWPDKCIEDIDIALSKASTVKGKVTDASTSNPIANTTLYVDFYCTGECTTHFSRDVETDDEGNYTLEGIQQGTYNVEFSIDDDTYYNPVWYNNTYDITKRTVLTVESDKDSTVDVAFQPLGAVSGTVTNEQGEGIEGVQVCLRKPSQSDDDDCIAQATTDKDGKYTLKGWDDWYDDYTLEGVEAGVYTLEFDPDPYGYGSDYLPEYYNDKGSSDTADTFSVAWGQTTTIDAKLADAMELTVNVKDSKGEPIEYASLRLYDVASSSWYNNYTPSSEEDGTYTFTGVYPGRYRLWAEAGTYKSQWYKGIETENLDVDGQKFQQATVIDLTTTDTSVDVTLNNAGTGTLSGYVNDEQTGEPIYDALVTLYDAFSGDELRYTYTDEDGQYEFEGLNGTYKLAFDADCYVWEYFDDSTTLEDATVVSALDGKTATADAALVYSGRIGVAVKGGDTNAPVYEAHVTAENVATGVRYDGVTNEDGTVIIDVPAGNYRLSVGATGNYAAYEGTGTHTVATEQQIGVDVVLQASGSVVGRVTDAATGLPIENAWVNLYYDSFDLTVGYYDQTDSNGYYSIPGVEAGKYRIKFGANGYKSQFYNDKTEWAEGDVINVADGTKTTANAALQLGGAVGGFVGRVTRSDGAPASSVEVSVYDAATGEVVGSDTTSSNGDYDITVDVEDSSGSYNVQYMPPNGSGFAMEWYNDKASRTNADDQSLAKGEIKTLDVVLEAASGAINGTVTAADTSDALPGVEVTAYDPTTGEQIGYDYTNQQGAYSITGLRDGSYVVESGSSDEYSGHYFNAQADWASANAVTVAGGTPATANFTLHKAGIKGTVKSSDGRGVPEIEVNFMRIQGGWYDTMTDADGTYSMMGLPAGTYYVYADTYYMDIPGFVDTWFGNTAYRHESTPVDVGIDGVKDAPITLLESASLSGKVVDEDTGAGLAGVLVELDWEYYMYTNDQGEYSFTDLDPGSYSIFLNFPGRGAMSVYPDQWYDRVVHENDAQWVDLEAGEDKDFTIRASRTPSEHGLNAFGVDVSPATDARLGMQGDSVTYQLNVTNIGTLEDTYTITYTGDWDATVVKTVGPLASGASTTVEIEVAVPEDAGNSESDQTSVTVISQGDSTKTDGAKLTTTASDIAPPPAAGDIIIAPSKMSQMGLPGEEVTYNLQVVNMGETSDTVTVTVESDWTATVTPTEVSVGAQQRVNVMVHVMIPEDATHEVSNTAKVTITSHQDPTKQDTSELTTHAFKGLSSASDVRVAPSSASASSVPGMYVQYTVEVCNTSNVSDTLIVENEGSWATTLSTNTLALESGGCANVVVTVTIPKTATGEESDDTVLTITTEQSDASAKATLTTEVATQSKLIEPGVAASFDSDDGRINLSFTGLAKLTRFMYTPLVTPTQDVSGLGTGMSYFLIEAVDVDTGQKIQQLGATEQVTLTIKYTTEELEQLGITGSTLRAYVWNNDSQQWVQLATTSNAASLAADGSISLPIDRLGEIVFLGKGQTTVYLPVIMR